MMAVDARGRPVLASVAYSVSVFVTVSATLARMPAFVPSLPSVPETALAAAVTVLGRLGRGVLARGAVEQLERVLARDWLGRLIAKIEAEMMLPRLTTLERLAKALGVPVEELLE
jgi:hypothetical protein